MSAFENFYIPDIDEFSDVEIIEVSVSAGDAIAAGDTLITIESDKLAMDVQLHSNLIHFGIGLY